MEKDDDLTLPYLEDENVVLCCGNKNEITFQNIETSQTVGRIYYQGSDSFAISMIRVGEHHVCMSTVSRIFRLWNLKERRSEVLFDGHLGSVRSLLCFRNPSLRIISEGSDSKLIFWNISGEKIHTMQVHELGAESWWLRDTFYSPRHNFITLGSQKEKGGTINPEKYIVKLIDLQKLCVSRELYGHTSYIYGCNISDDENYLCSYSYDGTFRIWDPRIEECVHKEDLDCSGIRFSLPWNIGGGNQEMIVSAKEADHKMHFWDFRQRKVLCERESHERRCDRIEKLPNRRLVSCSRDGSLIVWQEDGMKIRTMKPYEDSSDNSDRRNRYSRVSDSGINCVLHFPSSLSWKKFSDVFNDRLERINFMAENYIDFVITFGSSSDTTIQCTKIFLYVS